MDYKLSTCESSGCNLIFKQLPSTEFGCTHLFEYSEN